MYVHHPFFLHLTERFWQKLDARAETVNVLLMAKYSGSITRKKARGQRCSVVTPVL